MASPSLLAGTSLASPTGTQDGGEGTDGVAFLPSSAALIQRMRQRANLLSTVDDGDGAEAEEGEEGEAVVRRQRCCSSFILTDGA